MALNVRMFLAIFIHLVAGSVMAKSLILYNEKLSLPEAEFVKRFFHDPHYNTLFSGAQFAKKEILERGLKLHPVEIVVIDTGADPNHTSLKKISSTTCYNWNLEKKQLEKVDECKDDDGHGTHVLGTIAGAGRIGFAIPSFVKAHVVDLRDLNEKNIKIDEFYRALKKWGRQIKVMNLSIAGGEFGDIVFARSSRAELQDMESSIFKAAGNDGPYELTEFFSDLPEVFQVAAMTPFGYLADFSQSATTTGISAPGEMVSSALSSRVKSKQGVHIKHGEKEDIVLYDGTSMATPAVAGTATLLYEINPDLNREQVYTILRNSATAPFEPSKGKRKENKRKYKRYHRQLNTYRAYRIAERLDAKKVAWKEQLKEIVRELRREGCRQSKKLLAREKIALSEGMQAYFLEPEECHSRRVLARALLNTEDPKRYGHWLVALSMGGSRDQGKSFALIENVDEKARLQKLFDAMKLQTHKNIVESIKEKSGSEWLRDIPALQQLGMTKSLHQLYQDQLQTILTTSYGRDYKPKKGEGTELVYSKLFSFYYSISELTYSDADSYRKILESTIERAKKSSVIKGATLFNCLGTYPGFDQKMWPIWEALLVDLDKQDLRIISGLRFILHKLPEDKKELLSNKWEAILKDPKRWDAMAAALDVTLPKFFFRKKQSELITLLIDWFDSKKKKIYMNDSVTLEEYRKTPQVEMPVSDLLEQVLLYGDIHVVLSHKKRDRLYDLIADSYKAAKDRKRPISKLYCSRFKDVCLGHNSIKYSLEMGTEGRLWIPARKKFFDAGLKIYDSRKLFKEVEKVNFLPYPIYFIERPGVLLFSPLSSERSKSDKLKSSLTNGNSYKELKALWLTWLKQLREPKAGKGQDLYLEKFTGLLKKQLETLKKHYKFSAKKDIELELADLSKCLDPSDIEFRSARTGTEKLRQKLFGEEITKVLEKLPKPWEKGEKVLEHLEVVEHFCSVVHDLFDVRRLGKVIQNLEEIKDLQDLLSSKNFFPVDSFYVALPTVLQSIEFFPKEKRFAAIQYVIDSSEEAKEEATYLNRMVKVISALPYLLANTDKLDEASRKLAPAYYKSIIKRIKDPALIAHFFKVVRKE